MNSFILSIISFWGVGCFAQQTTSSNLPAEFNNDLIALSIPLEDDTLMMYTDTGGKNFIYQSGRKKLGFRRSRKNVWEKSNLEKHLVKEKIPTPFLKEMYFMNDPSSPFDGMLGREWFANKVWEFDYVNHTLKHLDPPTSNDENAFHSMDLHFLSDSLGNPVYHLARIQLIVGFDTLSMLLDTGAQAFFSTEAQQQLKKGKLSATSFISTTIFEKWRKAHPEWTVIPAGDVSFGKEHDIIILPEVQIGNKTVGPVEFTKRADSNFEIMSERFMDQEIVGALGGNALSLLDVFIVDYISQRLILSN